MKRVTEVEEELALLRSSLESKEKELQVLHAKAERLRQVEEQLQQAEVAEGARLRALAGALTGEYFPAVSSLVECILAQFLVAVLWYVGSVGVEVAASTSEESNTLHGAVDAVSSAADAVRAATDRAAAVLKLLHENVFPEEDLPEGLDPLAAAFGAGGGLLESFVRETMVSGLATSFVVLLGHGVPLDDGMVATVPDYMNEQSARATELARRLQLVVEAAVCKSEGAK